MERLLRLPRSTIRALIEAGFVSPARGPRRAWLFSFRDLIVLRTAQALAVAKVPRKRITRSMKELRRHLPESMPLSGLSISAVADRVVVREGRTRWQAESGQYLLAFEGNPADGSLSVVERKDAVRKDAASQTGAQDWFERGVSLEAHDAEAALQAYEQAVAANPGHLDAQVNLGCLLHETGHLPRAEAAYRAALAPCGNDSALHYNLAVLLEDLGRKEEALEAYQEALRRDPGLADCYYNMALLCEDLQKPREAIRHMAQYRKLTRRT